MITAPKNTNAHVASAWTAGIALLCLGIGLQGATTPLLPPLGREVKVDLGDEIMVEEFNPPPAPTADETTTPPPVEEEVVEEIEIPPVPEIALPITPPEMVEITPLDPIIEKPKPMPVVRPPEPKPVTKTTPPKPRPSANAGSGTGAPGGSGAPTMFSGGGRGRFPSPSYPSAARSARLQGSVRLLVTVETNGVPSSVSITSSSGSAVLDTAARDTIQRRWRWPSGEVRRYIVPIRFILQ